MVYMSITILITHYKNSPCLLGCYLSFTLHCPAIRCLYLHMSDFCQCLGQHKARSVHRHGSVFRDHAYQEIYKFLFKMSCKAYFRVGKSPDFVGSPFKPWLSSTFRYHSHILRKLKNWEVESPVLYLVMLILVYLIDRSVNTQLFFNTLLLS